ncbi:signal recognition particle-docking protein FtsY [Nocardia sp. A7]|uniref:signal recognition particle-docking protein FtsY n=1 Tax=Nocardia sp. A7 TaxID=2789274 RepID=UPI0039792ED1
MSSQAWILIAAIAAVLLVALVAGFVLYKRRQISLAPPEPDKELTDRSGGYTASGGFSFSQGGSTATVPKPEPVGERTDTDGQPHVGDDAAIPRDAPRRGITDVPLPEGDVAVDETVVVPDDASTLDTVAPAEPDTAAAVPTETVPTDTAPTDTTPAEIDTTPAEIDATTTAIDEIDPTTGRLVRLRGRLARSQNAVGKSLLGLLGGGDLDEDSWEEIEDTLVLADIGTASTAKIVERLREEMASRSVRTPEQARGVLRDVLVEALRPDLDRSIHALPHGDKPAILLVVGVNGTGKTTTTGKLARVLVADGRRVLLGAADTFRAAAADQLQTWGERVGAETVRGKEAADPAAVAFDAVTAGIDGGVDAVLIDTAGRLHTKTGLMDELGKVKRVVEKKGEVDEVLLVLDATVGQNGLMQARVFADVVDITGVVLTKLDGTAKGGIVFQVQHELGVPVKLVGLGEGADDLAPFEPGAFVDALLGGTA